jgi:hypothetical protein
MREITLRKHHRYLGLVLLPFLTVQTVTGLLYSLQYVTMPPLSIMPLELRFLHYGYEMPGTIYRIVLALAILVQAWLGLIIYFRIWSRARRQKGAG